VANGIAALTDLQAYLKQDAALLSAQDLTFSQAVLDSAAGFVQKISGRIFSPQPALVGGADTAPPVTKTFSARGRRRLRVPDLRLSNDLVVQLDGVSLTAATAYDLGPGLDEEPATYITLSDISPYVAIRPLWTSILTITGRWGFNPTPPEIKDAVCVLAARAWRDRDANWVDQMQTADGALYAYFRQLPQRVQDTVLGYKRTRVAVIPSRAGG
jgi:hypothetical protein